MRELSEKVGRNMEPIDSVVPFLRRWFRLCGSCGGRCRSQKLTTAIASDERLTRYLFSKSDFSVSAGRAKQRAFLPEKFRGDNETSMGRLTRATTLRVA